MFIGISCNPSVKVPNDWLANQDHFLLSLSVTDPNKQETTKPIKKHRSGRALSFEHFRSNLSTMFSRQETVKTDEFEQSGRRLVKTPWKDCYRSYNHSSFKKSKILVNMINSFHEVDIAAANNITDQPATFCRKVENNTWKYSLSTELSIRTLLIQLLYFDARQLRQEQS